VDEDVRQLKEAMLTIGGHLQDMQGEQSASTREMLGLKAQFGVLQGHLAEFQRGLAEAHGGLSRLEARSLALEAGYAALGGTFASIERILTNLLADRERLATVEKDNASLRQTVADLARRVEALEKRAS